MAKKKTKRGIDGKLSLLISVLAIVLVFAGFIGYNKYLDWRNVEDMKQLLADFEQLESDMEAETGEQFYIEATCGPASEKFSTSYSCRIVLVKANSQTMFNKSILTNGLSDCELLNNGRGNFKGALRCSLNVRNGNTQQAEEIFIDYDTSPNSRV